MIFKSIISKQYNYKFRYASDEKRCEVTRQSHFDESFDRLFFTSTETDLLPPLLDLSDPECPGWHAGYTVDWELVSHYPTQLLNKHGLIDKCDVTHNRLKLYYEQCLDQTPLYTPAAKGIYTSDVHWIEDLMSVYIYSMNQCYIETTGLPKIRLLWKLPLGTNWEIKNSQRGDVERHSIGRLIILK